MLLGAYSIVRYSNNLNDQRVNLGVLVWHPFDGFAYRFSPSLDRAQAVDPRLRMTPLKKQLDMIKGILSKSAGNGREVLLCLSDQFREGLEVTPAYPAKIQSLSQILDHLYEMLISPIPEIVRASTQRQFENRVKTALASAVGKLEPKGKSKDIGSCKVNGVSVDVGIRTTVGKKTALWHALSLQSKDRPTEQITAAKAAAMEIATIRGHLKDFKNALQMVVLQPPKPKASENLTESIAWLNHEADEVIPVAEIESLAQILQTKLTELAAKPQTTK